MAERYFDEAAQVFVNPSTDLTELWEEYYDENGTLYFYERYSGGTAWELPWLSLQNFGENDFQNAFETTDSNAYNMFDENSSNPGLFQQASPNDHEAVATESATAVIPGAEVYNTGANTCDYESNYSNFEYAYFQANEPAWRSDHQEEWLEYFDEDTQLPYYINSASGESAWERPDAYQPPTKEPLYEQLSYERLQDVETKESEASSEKQYVSPSEQYKRDFNPVTIQSTEDLEIKTRDYFRNSSMESASESNFVANTDNSMVAATNQYKNISENLSADNLSAWWAAENDTTQWMQDAYWIQYDGPNAPNEETFTTEPVDTTMCNQTKDSEATQDTSRQKAEPALSSNDQVVDNLGVVMLNDQGNQTNQTTAEFASLEEYSIPSEILPTMQEQQDVHPTSFLVVENQRDAINKIVQDKLPSETNNGACQSSQAHSISVKGRQDEFTLSSATTTFLEEGNQNHKVPDICESIKSTSNSTEPITANSRSQETEGLLDGTNDEGRIELKCANNIFTKTNEEDICIGTDSNLNNPEGASLSNQGEEAKLTLTMKNQPRDIRSTSIAAVPTAVQGVNIVPESDHIVTESDEEHHQAREEEVTRLSTKNSEKLYSKTKDKKAQSQNWTATSYEMSFNVESSQGQTETREDQSNCNGTQPNCKSESSLCGLQLSPKRMTLVERRMTRKRDAEREAKLAVFAPRSPLRETRHVQLRIAPPVSQARTEILHDAGGQLTKGYLLKLLASNSDFRSKFKLACGGWTTTPSKLDVEFSEADRDNDKTLNETEWQRFCTFAARRARGGRRTLTSYENRVKKNDAATKGLETAQIKVTIPEQYKELIDVKYSLEPYSHFARQKTWDNFFKARDLTRKMEIMRYETVMRQRESSETKLRKEFDLQTKRTEEKRTRERKKLRKKLIEREKTKLRSRTVNKLLELTKDELDLQDRKRIEQEEEQRVNRSQRLKKLPTLKDIRQTTTRLIKRPSVMETDPNQPIRDLCALPLKDVECNEDAQKQLHQFLNLERQQEFKAWEFTATHNMNRLVEKEIDKVSAEELRESRKVAEDESLRREKFESETDSLRAAESQRAESFDGETVRLEFAEMQLRKLEHLAFSSLERQRRQFLDISSACFNRNILRRLVWKKTLKEFDKSNRSVFQTYDEMTKETQVLLRAPLGTRKENAQRTRECLELFHEVGTRSFLSRAQREDDRLPSYSKHLIKVHYIFSHKQRVNWEIYILTEFCHGQRLQDFMQRLHAESSRVGQLPEYILLAIGEQVSKGLRALHLTGLAHMGVEPACIFFNEKHEVKLGIPRDLQSLQLISDYQPRLAAATSQYAAPELSSVIIDPATSFDPIKADVWSIGAIMYHLATGLPLPSPFILSRLVAQPVVRQRNRWFRDLLRMTLQIRVAERASTTDLVDFFADVSDQLVLSATESMHRPMENLAPSIYT